MEEALDLSSDRILNELMNPKAVGTSGWPINLWGTESEITFAMGSTLILIFPIQRERVCEILSAHSDQYNSSTILNKPTVIFSLILL